MFLLEIHYNLLDQSNLDLNKIIPLCLQLLSLWTKYCRCLWH